MIDAIPVTSGRVARVFAFLALGVALIVFVTRGPIRGLAGGDDFDTMYAQGRAWLYGV